MDGVEAVRRRVAGNAARAPDTGYECDLVWRTADACEGAIDRAQHAEITAAGTPDRRELASVIVGSVRLRLFHCPRCYRIHGCKPLSGWIDDRADAAAAFIPAAAAQELGCAAGSARSSAGARALRWQRSDSSRSWRAT